MGFGVPAAKGRSLPLISAPDRPEGRAHLRRGAGAWSPSVFLLPRTRLGGKWNPVTQPWAPCEQDRASRAACHSHVQAQQLRGFR